MTEYLLIATHSGDWAMKQEDGSIKKGTSYYLVVTKKNKDTGIFGCRPTVVKCSDETFKEANKLRIENQYDAVAVNLYFDEDKKATGIKHV